MEDFRKTEQFLKRFKMRLLELEEKKQKLKAILEKQEKLS